MYDGLTFRESGWLQRFRTEVEDFASIYGDPLRRCSADAVFPVDVYREMGKRGWLAPFVAKDMGGLDAGVAEYCVIAEELARFGLVSPQIPIQGQRWILDWGTAEQQDKYLHKVAVGDWIFSESISEPGAGSSLKNLETTAVRLDGGWRINGQKTHVNLGAQCDVTLVLAVSDEGLTAFLVDMSTPGVSAVQTDPIGIRLVPTATLSFDDVIVPDEAVLGRPGLGLKVFLTTFNVSRLGNASELIGLARRALVEGIDYATHRVVGSNHVTDFQGIQWTIADAHTHLYAASLARNRAAFTIDNGGDPSLATTIAKKLAIDAAEKAVNDVYALIGSYGLYREQDFGAVLHDVKVLRVAGGSLEVLRNYVARRVLNSSSLEGLR